MACSFDVVVPPIVTLPLKGMKPADISSSLLQRLQASGKALSAEAQQAARAFSEVRARLEKIEKLTDTMAESAAQEFVRYASMLAGLERRFDDLGAELGLAYLWRDAWRPKMKASQTDLQFERVGALWNAAACYSYVGALAQPRGPSRGGLKEAYKQFQLAAGCLDAAHALVRGAVWGLTPRWEPSTLTPDIGLECLSAMRELMLAQAQRAFHEKCIAEGLGEELRAKVSTHASRGFGSVRAAMEGALAAHVAGDSGMFHSADHSMVGRIEASQQWALACAEMHAANVDAEPEQLEYGRQVVRLERAHDAARAALAAADAAKVPEREMAGVAHGAERLGAFARDARRENERVYMMALPHASSLAPLDAKAVAKPTPPPDADGGAAFAGVLLPSAVSAAVDAHHASIEDMLHELSSSTSQRASSVTDRLAALQLPESLDACTRDDPRSATKACSSPGRWARRRRSARRRHCTPSPPSARSCRARLPTSC